MKAIIKIITIITLVLSTGTLVKGQDKPKKVETKEIEVTGVCKMCKKRIEKAALGVKGVKLAEWDKNAQALKVIYKTKHASEKDICEALAKAGHDNEKVKATEENYQKLPDCCAYRDGVEVH